MRDRILYVIFVTAVLGLVFSACDSPNKVNDTSSDNEDGVLGMNVPANFNFTTTDIVDLRIDAREIGAKASVVKIYNGDPQKNGKLLQTLYVEKGKQFDTKLNLPSYLNNIWVVSNETSGSSGTVKVPVSGGSLSVDLTAAGMAGAGMSLFNIDRVTDGLVAFYPFVEGSGNSTADFSSFGSALDLEFGGTVDWLSGRNGVVFSSSDAIARSNDPATKLFDELTSENAFTLEVWGKPANLTQTGPARMMTMSQGTSNRNFTLGQGPFGGSGEDIEFRVRTTGTDNNGLPGHEVSNTVTLDETHYVVTWDGSDLKYYQDGILVQSFSKSGDLSNWNANYEFALGNETSADRGWLGEMYLAAVYNRALDDSEVMQNYSEGSVIEDEFPGDPDRFFTSHFPAEDTFGTLMYEDLWPSFGDYDMNDLVISYNIKEVSNIFNEIVDIEFTMAIRAVGASLESGFGIEFPLSPSAVASVDGARYTTGLISNSSNGTESGQSNAVVMLWDESSAEMGLYVNTVDPAEHVDEDSITVTVTFDPPVSRADLGVAPYKPFIFVDNNRGREVHLPGNAPTSLADPSFFGTEDDDSDPSQDRFYKSETNLNWAINIPEEIPYPLETIPIIDAYLKFQSWAESGGTVDTDWFKDLPGHRDNSKLYFKP